MLKIELHFATRITFNTNAADNLFLPDVQPQCAYWFSVTVRAVMIWDCQAISPGYLLTVYTVTNKHKEKYICKCNEYMMVFCLHYDFLPPVFTLINAPTLITPPPRFCSLKLFSYMLKTYFSSSKRQILLKIGVF